MSLPKCPHDRTYVEQAAHRTVQLCHELYILPQYVKKHGSSPGRRSPPWRKIQKVSVYVIRIPKQASQKLSATQENHAKHKRRNKKNSGTAQSTRQIPDGSPHTPHSTRMYHTLRSEPPKRGGVGGRRRREGGEERERRPVSRRGWNAPLATASASRPP